MDVPADYEHNMYVASGENPAVELIVSDFQDDQAKVQRFHKR